VRRLAWILACGTILCSCNIQTSAERASSTAAPTPQQGKLRIAIVLPGSASDKGFNESAAKAASELEAKFGAEVAVAEMTQPPAFEQTLEQYGSAGYDVIVGHGFEFGEVVARLAPRYPRSYFFVTNNPVVAGPNFKGLQPASNESAYLAGAVAASISKSKKIGAVGGFAFPVITVQIEAFEAGARATDPSVSVSVVYLDTFDDVTKGKEVGSSLVASGVDVLYHIADSAGLGVIGAAKESGVFAIGWGNDQYEVAPSSVATSQIVDQKEMIVRAIEAWRRGELPEGVWFFGLDSKVTGLAPIRVVDEETRDRANAAVASARERLARGAPELPSFDKADRPTAT
jgi:basic membrane protein A and related proteins